MDDDHVDLPPDPGDPVATEHATTRDDGAAHHLAQVLDEERHKDIASESAPAPNRYRQLLREADDASHNGSDDGDDTGSAEGLPRRVGSPRDSLLSVPDDSPSVQGSLISSPGSSVLPSVASRPGLSSPTPSFRPFDRRFQSRISSTSTLGPRPSSPAFLSAHSRNASMSSQVVLSDAGDTDALSPPWEVVRWTRLKKLSDQVFTETGRRNFGSPTTLAVSTTLAIGTSKGIILLFDYNQNLKMIIGPGTQAIESGPVTAIAVSADQTTIAGGHGNGDIFTWEMTRASRPFLHIPHLDSVQMQNRTQDGHMPNVSVTHVGFLGTRRTALVSADDRGMAFSHLATRGTGALGRTVKTARILGRYPDAPAPSGRAMKPSTVLAFSPLPLGNVECATDSLGLTAMLTPYLLVIVSTTPIAQTQHKSARPKDVAPHSAMSGCLAWFPAVKLKVPDAHTGSTLSKVKLVYCWSNVLTVLDVDEIPSENKDKPQTLKFKARSRWKCEESIVAVQWLSRSVITVLTITQRLIVLEDRSMKMTEAFDLLHKHIYHADLFSKQLHNLVEQLDEEDTSMHGVVADAFYMSLKTYKGRMFLLGFNDLSIGALSNWADRLIALMEHGDYVSAIQLATSYYTGDADKLTVGLPEDTATRHQMVRDKILEIMTASLKYVFGQRQKSRSGVDDSHLRDLAETCFIACHSVGDIDFLFDEMYEWFEEGEVEGVFLEALEPYILEGTITSVPPTAVKALVTHFASKGWEGRLEEMICHMDTATLDIDQITSLCKQHSLYDALIYVWNQALNDYITPLIDLLTLLVPLMQTGEYDSSGRFMNDENIGINALKMFPYLSYILTSRIYPNGELMDEGLASQAKAELYWFLFSGKSVAWPSGSKKVFLTRPAGNAEPSFPYLRMILKFDAPSFLSALNEAFEDSFLNDSQEKQLIGGAGRGLPEEQIFGLTVDRQYIVSILLELMYTSDFAPEDTIYLDMFIARNLPKFPQYLLIPGSTLNKVIAGLCHYPGADLAEDAQLSAEYLLSIYQPPDSSPLIPMFKEAGFYRILKRTYRNEKQFGKLLQTYFEDPEDQEQVFSCIAECLRPKSGLAKRQIQEVHDVIKNNSEDLVELDPAQSAKTLEAYAPELHRYVLDSLDGESELQYLYLKALLEPDEDSRQPQAKTPDRDFIEMYLQLMCKYNATHVADYIGVVQAANLRLEKLLPAMEDKGVIDAAVILMAREGQVQDGMQRLIKHLNLLESALQGLLAGTERNEEVNVQSAAEELLTSLQKYTHVGIWLCQGQMKTSKKTSNTVQRKQGAASASASSELSPDELLWLDLIDATVHITRRLSSIVTLSGEEDHGGKSASAADQQTLIEPEKPVALLRSLVQHTFTALLTATSTQGNLPNSSGVVTAKPSEAGAGTGSATFLRILRAFLVRAASTISPSLADLRSVLTSIFAAYAYEESILGLSNRLLDQQLFVNVAKAQDLRQRGWRPRGSTCEGCGGRVWGPGVAGAGRRGVFEAWEAKKTAEDEEREKRHRKKRVQVLGLSSSSLSPLEEGVGEGKGKGTATITSEPTTTGGVAGRQDNTNITQQPVDDQTGTQLITDENQQQIQQAAASSPAPLVPLVVLACRHIYHQTCLDALLQASSTSESQDGGGAAVREVDDYGREINGGGDGERAYRCPIDG